MTDPETKKSKLDQQVDRNIVNVEPGTLALVVFAFLLLPLLLAGFFLQ